MIRFLINFLFFLLPFGLYAIYLSYMRRQRPEEARHWSDAPVGWLLITGLALGLASLVFFVPQSGHDPYEPYTPRQTDEMTPRPWNGEMR